MILGKILLAVFFSLSMKSSNLPDKKADYEVQMGLKAKHDNHLYITYERENDVKYRALDLLTNYKYFTGTIFYKESKNLDYQSLSATQQFDNLSLGLSANAIEWADTQPMLIAIYKTDVLRISFETGFKRQIFQSTLSKDIPLNHNFYLTPMMQYFSQINKDSSKEFWQSKISISYKFDLKG